MKTELLPVDASHPDPAALARATVVLRRGGLVAFPTETVYGLGANALDEAAVQRLFAAKGRPATNPIIVHVTDAAAARPLAAAWPEPAEILASRFWPGPLTLVVAKHACVPAALTAGGPTVALRVPSHPVALGLLEVCGLALAAPSANRSACLSPTCGEHVLAMLDGLIDLVLDAGPTPGGLESTVLDVTTSPARLLRPGLVSPGALEAVLGPILRPEPPAAPQPRRSPGQLDRHYAPRTPLECAPDDGRRRVEEHLAQGLRVGWLALGDAPLFSHPALVTLLLPADAQGYAAGFYAALHQLDAADLDRLVVARAPEGEDWLAVRDRLCRAAHG